ncbi:MAG TPA: hypothetical protein VNR11_01350 [Xanthobacteraceae bacterium]|nr:hypothetical protein [Xanthobacteraceae bacterium]
MVQLASWFAGTAALLFAWQAYVTPDPAGGGRDTYSFDIGSARRVVAADTGMDGLRQRSVVPVTIVDRSGKGDRLRPSQAASPATRAIASVEFAPAGVVLMRDGEGALLFDRNPTERRTLVAKDVLLPQLTILDATPRARPAPPAPSRTPVLTGGGQPGAKRPAGCDPAFSPITAPQLGHLFGRCVTDVPGTTRLAMVQ